MACLSPAKELGALNDFRHSMFLAVGHDVYSVHTLDLTNLRDHVETDFDTLLGGLVRAAKAINYGVGNVDTGHVLANPFRRPC